MPSEQQVFSAVMDDMQVDTISAAIQPFYDPISFATEVEQSFVPEQLEFLQPIKKQSSATLSSLELLSNYRPSHNRLNVENKNALFDREDQQSKIGMKLSTEGLSSGEHENIKLSSLLLAAAEKVNNGHYDRATNLIKECFRLSSNTGNPVQRVVYYIAYALQEKVDRYNREISCKGTNEMAIIAQDMVKALQTSHPVQLATFRTLPLGQIMHFTSIQTILDNVASARRIHQIDLAIRHGIDWAILMQALATRSSCPIDYVKISAIGTSEDAINATGKRLIIFAESLSLSFVFKAVIVPDVKDLKHNMFDVEEGEETAVYFSMDMSTMIVRLDRFENVMRVIRKIRPSIMTVADVEAKHNSPWLINRFTEALFYYSAFFDCLASCIKDDGV